MMSIMDLSSISYIPARNGAHGPVDNRPAEIIVMHSMQCPADALHVTNWVQSLSSPAGGPYFAHYYTGPGVTYRVAPLGRTVWHCGNGNNVRGLWTLGVEQGGYAEWSRQQWIDSGALNTATPLVAALIAAGHGANRWLEIADLAVPGVRGVTSHNNMSHAFGGSDHTDPGPNYPHDLLLAPSPDIPLTLENEYIMNVIDPGNGHCYLLSGGKMAYITQPVQGLPTYKPDTASMKNLIAAYGAPAFV